MDLRSGFKERVARSRGLLCWVEGKMERLAAGHQRKGGAQPWAAVLC